MLQVSLPSVDDAFAGANRLLTAMMRTSVGLDLPVKAVMLDRGLIMNDEGDSPGSVVFPEGALLADVAFMADGRMIEVGAVGLDGASNLLASLAGRPAHHRTVVKIAGRARLVKASAIRAAVMKDSTLLTLAMSWLQRRALEAEQAIACSLMHDATQRLARSLLQTRERTGSNQLPLTQDDFAGALGVQRTTLNASALVLKADGAVRYSRGMLRILDPDKLADRACECHARIELGRGPHRRPSFARSGEGLRVASTT